MITRIFPAWKRRPDAVVYNGAAIVINSSIVITNDSERGD